MSDEHQHSQQLTIREERAAVTAGGAVAGLVPQNIEQAYRLAQAMHASGLAPSTLGSTEKVLVAIMAGAELGLPPFQAVQSFAVINNRPTIWGDGMLAVVRSHGCAVREWAEGQDDERVAWCEVKRPDTGETVTRDFSVADAKKAKLWDKQGPWQTNPKRMLQMRARAFALRDACADILRGFQMREEVEDYQTIRESRPQVSDLREKLEAKGERGAEGFNIENGETPEEVLAEVELPIAETERPEERPRIRRTADEMARGLTIDEAIAERAERPTTAPPAEPQPAALAPTPTEAATPASGPSTGTGDGSQDTGDATSDDDGSQHMAEIAKEEPRPQTAAASTAPSAPEPAAPSKESAGVASATEEPMASTSAPHAQELDLMVDVEEEVDPVTVFINTVGRCGSWVEGVASLGQLMRLRALEPHELNGARAALWNSQARVRDKVDPAAHPTNFCVWLAIAFEEDQVDGTLMTLENSAEWARLTPAQHDKVRVQAAQAKIRIRNRGAEMS